MQIEISDRGVRFSLHGKSGIVEDRSYKNVGMQLMNEMWKAVAAAKIRTTGINHWVYLADNRMFVGVEVENAGSATIPGELQPLDFELGRHMKHVHIGPYDGLPQKWKDLQAELVARGETVGCPSLEVYGHHSEDPSKCETTILIGLEPQAK